MNAGGQCVCALLSATATSRRLDSDDRKSAKQQSMEAWQGWRKGTPGPTKLLLYLEHCIYGYIFRSLSF